MKKPTQTGTIEWVHAGERYTQAVTRLLVRWPDGKLTGPLPFTGQLVVGGAADDAAWVFHPDRQQGTLAELLDWCSVRSGPLILGAVLGAAVYRNLLFLVG